MAPKRRRADSDTGEAERDNAKRASPVDQRKEAIRSQWEFAALHQFLYLFGDALKVAKSSTLVIEDLEDEFINPSKGQKLAEIQLGLLGNVSSQRGLTIDQFEDYTRRQYRAREVTNHPFGEEEQPIKFRELEPQVQVRVLHQLTQWIVFNTERFREKIVTASKDGVDQTDWRIEPIGWDAKGNSYFYLDDNRLYTRSEAQFITYPKKAKSRSKPKSRSKGSRSSARTSGDIAEETKDDQPDDPLQKMEWKCVCANLEEYKALLEKLSKSRNLDEKELYSQIMEGIMPVIEKEEQVKQRKALEAEKEEARQLLLMNRKRSSRIDERMARQKEAQEREAKEREERAIEEAAHKEQMKRQKEEDERRSKLMERERRLQLRDQRAKVRHQEIERLKEEAEDSAESSGSSLRKSSRSRNKREAELNAAAEEDEWVFDCICGVHGANYDDGTKSICCDKCSIWQHTACLNLPDGAEEAEFICERCLLKASGALPEQASPRVVLRLRLPQRNLPQPMSEGSSDTEDADETEEERDDDATISERSRSASPMVIQKTSKTQSTMSDENKALPPTVSSNNPKANELPSTDAGQNGLSFEQNKGSQAQPTVTEATIEGRGPAIATSTNSQTTTAKAQIVLNGNVLSEDGSSDHGKLQFQRSVSPAPHSRGFNGNATGASKIMSPSNAVSREGQEPRVSSTSALSEQSGHMMAILGAAQTTAATEVDKLQTNGGRSAKDIAAGYSGDRVPVPFPTTQGTGAERQQVYMQKGDEIATLSPHEQLTQPRNAEMQEQIHNNNSTNNPVTAATPSAAPEVSMSDVPQVPASSYLPLAAREIPPPTKPTTATTS